MKIKNCATVLIKIKVDTFCKISSLEHSIDETIKKKKLLICWLKKVDNFSEISCFEHIIVQMKPLKKNNCSPVLKNSG